MKFSAWQLVRQAINGHSGWCPMWRDATPRQDYEVVIVGGGGHGLATAYYLAKEHDIHDVGVLEKGWLGGGNTGRNTTVVRSNYLHPASAAFYDFSVRLYEGLSRELNYNVMFSQRGLVTLAHSAAQLDGIRRWTGALHANGIDAEILDRTDIEHWAPSLNLSSTARFPIVGGYVQQRAGTARHDAVAWGYARAASGLGVDIVQDCEVTGMTMRHGYVAALETTRGTIKADKVVLAVAGHSTSLAGMARIELPIESHSLQAFVSEPVKPFLDTCVLSSAVHAYISQSDKGEVVLGGGWDSWTSYAQRGSYPVLEHVVEASVELFPCLSRLKVMRQWAGIIDLTPDMSPILGKTAIPNLYLSCGWGAGGFKAIPAGGWTLAHTVAHDAPHPLNEVFSLTRFGAGRLIDESGAASVTH